MTISVCNYQIDSTHNLTEYTHSRTVWQFDYLSFHFSKTSDNRWRFHIGLCFFSFPSILMSNAYYLFNTAGKCLFQSCQYNPDTRGLSLFITPKSDHCLSFINCGRKLLTIFAKLSVHGHIRRRIWAREVQDTCAAIFQNSAITLRAARLEDSPA